MSTPAQAKAQRAYEDRRRVSGERKMAFWLSETARAALARLRAEDGSNDASVEIAILALDMQRKAKKRPS